MLLNAQNSIKSSVNYYICWSRKLTLFADSEIYNVYIRISWDTSLLKHTAHIHSVRCLCECAILRRPVFSRWLCSGEQLSVCLGWWEASCPVWDNRALGPSDASFAIDNSTCTHLQRQTSLLSCLCWKQLHWLIWMGTHHFPMQFFACENNQTG